MPTPLLPYTTAPPLLLATFRLLVLQGPRRMDKTSFLLQLPALLPGQTLPVFLDLQRPAMTQSPAAFLFNLARAISRDVRPYRLIIAPPQRSDFEAAPYEAFAAWLEDVVLSVIQGFNLLLTFDEFEKLGEAVEAGRLDRQIFDELRYLTHRQPYLLQLLCSAIVEESNARATLHADQAILEAALARALDQGEPYFRNVWDEMAGPDGQPLRRQAAGAGRPISLPDSPALTRLVRRRVLTRTDGGCCLEIPLVERWIVERAP